jgi:hypothetical protein
MNNSDPLSSPDSEDIFKSTFKVRIFVLRKLGYFVLLGNLHKKETKIPEKCYSRKETYENKFKFVKPYKLYYTKTYWQSNF